MIIPGLIDVHVHLREPGATHKEDFSSGTAAALAGGFTTVLAMPNTQPAIVDADALKLALDAASEKAHCDYGIFLGGSLDNAEVLPSIASRSAGLKLYLDATYGSLLLGDTENWRAHFAHWPRNLPIVAHAEGSNLGALLFLAALYDRPVHIAHVSRREEILMIRAAKEKGYLVTCEVAPHHLFLTTDDVSQLGSGRSEVRPRLATGDDQQALWDNLEVIDCFATDHAPHLLDEKNSKTPPPGFPGLETALPLLLTAVDAGRLTLDDVLTRMVVNPRRIFDLPEQSETWVEIDLKEQYKIRAELLHTKCAWSPFEDWQVRGRVRCVVLRGKEVFKDGEVLSIPGFGQNIREAEINGLLHD